MCVRWLTGNYSRISKTVREKAQHKSAKIEVKNLQELFTVKCSIGLVNKAFLAINRIRVFRVNPSSDKMDSFSMTVKMSKFAIFWLPMMIAVLSLQAVAQISGGGSSSGGSSSGVTWPAQFPYPTDFPPLPNGKVTTNGGAGDITGVFKATYIDGLNWIEYTFQEYSPSSGVVRRLKYRDKKWYSIAERRWWWMERSGFDDVLSDVHPLGNGVWSGEKKT